VSKGKEFRPRRRRGFDDDFEAPRGFVRPESRPRQEGFSPAPQAPTSSAPPVKAVVKWFKPDKGFGFVELADGRGDAFLHVSALQAAGHDAVGPGATLEVQVSQGQKGLQVAAVQAVDLSTQGAAPAPRPGGGGDRGGGSRRPPVDTANAVGVTGRVKWFNAEKGFGFIACDDGQRDVFVHISTLRSSGIETLSEGQEVQLKVMETPKGREALSLQLANAG
jgi:CspA family cold shock protein